MLSQILDINDRHTLRALKDFQFDWSKKSNPTSIVFSAQVDNEIVGLIEFFRDKKENYNFLDLIEVVPPYRGSTVAGELLASVGYDSLEQGFDGFVVFESKTVIYSYYIKKYGAIPSKGRKLYFDTEATLKLIKTYLGGQNV